MEKIKRCYKIIEQINNHSINDYLFTADVGKATGVQKRSGFRYFDRLWAWWNGVSCDKNEVADSIAQAFKDVNFDDLGVKDETLQRFCSNLSLLRQKFKKSGPFSNKQLSDLISSLADKVFRNVKVLLVNQTTRGGRKQRRNASCQSHLYKPSTGASHPTAKTPPAVNTVSSKHIASNRSLKPTYPVLTQEEVSQKIKRLNVASFDQELGLLEQNNYPGNLAADKEKILDLIIRNNETVVRQTSPRGTDFQLFKRLFEGIDYAKQKIHSNPAAWTGPAITTKAQTIESYVEKNFGKSKNPRKLKSARRAMHFAKQGYWMQPSRGDGNCFTNSLAAGLMDVVKKTPSYRRTLIEKLRYFQGCQDRYVSPDMKPSAPPYSQSFTKESDFAKVLDALEEGKENLDNHTMAAFSRVLRYILTLKQFENVYIEGATSRVGEPLGFANIFTFNRAFELDARVLVLEAEPSIDKRGVAHPNEQDPADASFIFRASGTQNGQSPDDPKTKMGSVKITDLLQESPSESFNVIRTDGHFDLMVRK